MTADLTPVTTAVQAYGDQMAADAKAADAQALTIANATITDLHAQVANLQHEVDVLEHPAPPAPTPTPRPTPIPTPGPTPAPTRKPLLIGGRAADIPFSEMDRQIGPCKVTRFFYTGDLPTAFTSKVPAGVRIIVSCKTLSAARIQSYVASIPPGAPVELTFHHEPEADYTAGSQFVAEFDAFAAKVHAVRGDVPVAFIGGGYQYRPGGAGADGSFIPTRADKHYLDTYQRTTLLPAAKDPHVQGFLAALKTKGKAFHGFTEYGRGVSTATAPLSAAALAARPALFAADKAYLLSIPTAEVWSYWFTTDLASGDQWRMADPASQAAWRALSTN